LKFTLEIDLDRGVMPDNPTAELSRILRYWAGNLKHYSLVPGTSESISDSTYATVGTWAITEKVP
jgi:hypothetical protein